MYDVIALGELLIDFAAKETDSDGYPTMKANPGGAPGNFLAALNKYGAKTAFLGKVGDDAFGKLLLKTFEKAGIETKGIVTDPSVFTTLAFVTFSPEGDRSFSFARKPGADTRLSFEEIEHEMQVIAKTGMEEILMLTGESRVYSDVHYIGEAVKIAKKYFKNIGIEIYPVNVDEYRYLHECGVDYVTVFQETYNTDKYETLHLMGHKRVWPYRFDSQERALMGGMRGAGFSALLGLDDFRKDALATALHVYYINRKYPHAELSLSCPRLRPIVNNDKINPRDVGEKELCQVLCAYRIFLPFAGITVSSRESADFRNGITKICATKVSAGVSTGIGDHEEKYEGKQEEDVGDEQFEINDSRSFKTMYDDMEQGGLQPVLNDYIYV